LLKELTRPERAYCSFDGFGGNGIGEVPMPNALTDCDGFGGKGIGDVPMPNALTACDGFGGNGIGEVPIPVTLLRIEAPLATTNTASANAIKEFFTALSPVQIS